jgi:hypothetical protein
MINADRSVLRTRIAAAEQQLATAEQELTDALRELRAGARADKTHVGARIERAFETLQAARQNLVALEAMLLPDDGSA